MHQLSGYSTWAVSIRVSGPEEGGIFTNPAGNFDLASHFPAGPPSTSAVDTVVVNVNLDGTEHSGLYLQETSAASGIFTGTLPGGVPMRLTLKGIVSSAPGVLPSAILLVGEPGQATAYNVSLRTDPNSPGMFTGGYVGSSAAQGAAAPPPAGAAPPPGAAAEPPPPFIVSVEDYARLIRASKGGELHPYVITAGMPEALAGEFQVEIGGQIYHFWKHPQSGQILAVEHGGPESPALMSFRPVTTTPPELTEKDADYYEEAEHLSFIEGFSHGLNAGGIELVNGSVTAVKVWAEYVGRGLIVYGTEVRILAHWAAGNDTTEMEQMMFQVGAPNLEIHEQAAGIYAFLAPLLLNSAEQHAQFQLAMATGNVQLFMTALHGSEEHQTVFMMISEALVASMKDYEDGTPGQRGYMCGRIWFEAVSALIPFTRLKNLPQIAKVAVMERLQGSGLLRSGAAAVTASTKAGLLISKMCFVAGTVVLTQTGPLPIQDIQPGMWVWSRDEVTGETGWKRVVQTFITHPSALYRLTYELRGPPPEDNRNADTPVRAETLGVTAPHPFWVGNRERPGFVMAEDLRKGDELLTADGRSAVVTANVAEQAQAGAVFTTYNFEVEDFHTYFVGDAGVWVHNFSNLFCDELQAVLDHIRRVVRQIPDGESLDGKKFGMLDEGFNLMKARGEVIMAKQGNFAMHVTGAEELAAYARRFPNGSANNPVEEIFDYTTQKQMQQKFVGHAKPGQKAYHYEVHHLSERRVSSALGIPEKAPDGKNIWDTSPSINLPERPPPENGGFDAEDVEHYRQKFGRDPVYHQGTDGNGIAQAIGKIFTDMGVPYKEGVSLSIAQKDEMIRRLCHLYQHDVRYRHLQAWPATRDWLRKHVHPSLDVPDLVDFDEF